MIARDEVEIWGGGYDRAVPEWERSIEFSAGYFVYDFVFMMLPSTACEESPSKEMLFHHVVSIQTHYWPVCVCKYGIAMSVVGYLAELSTPFANARWMLKEAGGGTGTAVYLANGALLTASFFLCRICAVGFLLYMMFVAHPRFTGGLSLGTAMGGGLGHIVAPLTVAFYCLNLVWMWKDRPRHGEGDEEEGAERGKVARNAEAPQANTATQAVRSVLSALGMPDAVCLVLSVVNKSPHGQFRPKRGGKPPEEPKVKCVNVLIERRAVGASRHYMASSSNAVPFRRVLRSIVLLWF